MNLPPGTKRRTVARSPRCAPTAAPPPAAPPPAHFTLYPARPPFSSATRDEAEKFLHVSSWILNKNTAAAAAGAGAAPPPPPRASRSRTPRPPLTWELRRGAAPGGRGARRPALEQQQAAEPEGGGAEESPGSPLRRHLFPASGGGGSAAEPSPPSLPRASASPSLQARLPRPPPQPLLQPGPARPARPLSREGRLGGASLLQRGGERRRAESGESLHSGAGRWVLLQVPGAATHRRLRLHTAAQGGRRPRAAGVGGGDPGRAPPRTRRRAPPSPTPPRLRARPAPAPIPAAASRAAAAGMLPSPFSPEPGTGAGSARRALLLASGKPRRSGSSSPSSSSWPPRTGEKFPPPHLSRRLWLRRPEGERRSEPGLVREAGAGAHLFQPGPRAPI